MRKFKKIEKSKIYEGDYSTIVGIDRLRNNIKYNTDSERKSIVKQYGKYVISDESYIDSDIDKLYSKLKADTRQLKCNYILQYFRNLKIFIFQRDVFYTQDFIKKSIVKIILFSKKI